MHGFAAGGLKPAAEMASLLKQATSLTTRFSGFGMAVCEFIRTRGTPQKYASHPK
jgi:hypothetical protein